MKANRTLLATSLAIALVAPLALLAQSQLSDRIETDKSLIDTRATTSARAVPSAPTQAQSTTSRLVHGLLSDSRYAYRPRALDDALSQDVLKRYLESLDPGKVFFTAQDAAGFDQYRTRLDDAIKAGELDPAWTIFSLYRQRVNERIGHARGLLKGGFEFTSNDRYNFDREDAPWAADTAALDMLWKQSVKNDWLRLKLAGKQPDEIRKTLDKRYANLLDSVAEIKGEEVFQSFLNA